MLRLKKCFSHIKILKNMKSLLKTLSHTDLRPGIIYNREYIGPNETYKKSKGGTTFMVVPTGKKFVIRELYSPSRSISSEHHMGGEITFSEPENICNEYNVYECSDSKRWFIHKKVMTLKEAISTKAINLGELKNVFRDQSTNFTRTNPVSYYEKKAYFSMTANPTKEYPYLSGVVFVFKNTDDLKLQVRKFFPDAWFVR
jgi:hypothetical protein